MRWRIWFEGGSLVDVLRGKVVGQDQEDNGQDTSGNEVDVGVGDAVLEKEVDVIGHEIGNIVFDLAENKDQ